MRHVSRVVICAWAVAATLGSAHAGPTDGTSGRTPSAGAPEVNAIDRGMNRTAAHSLDLAIFSSESDQNVTTYVRTLKSPSDSPVLQSAISGTLPGVKDTWTWAGITGAKLTVAQSGMEATLEGSISTAIEMRTATMVDGVMGAWGEWGALGKVDGASKQVFVMKLPMGATHAQFRAMPSGQASWQIETHLLLDLAAQK